MRCCLQEAYIQGMQQESPKTYTVEAAKITEGLEKCQPQLSHYVPELETRVRSVCQDRAPGPPADGKHLGMTSSFLLESHFGHSVGTCFPRSLKTSLTDPVPKSGSMHAQETKTPVTPHTHLTSTAPKKLKGWE